MGAITYTFPALGSNVIHTSTRCAVEYYPIYLHLEEAQYSCKCTVEVINVTKTRRGKKILKN